MKNRICLSVIAFLLFVSFSCAETIKMVPFQKVQMNDNTWQPRIRILAKDTLPHAFHETEVALNRLRKCAEYQENNGGPKPEPHRFNTSDLYKVMEGGAMMIQAEPNPEIEKLMDNAIDIISRAQQSDGYLYVSHICGNPIVNEMGPRPYSYVQHSHELYNMGHLYEAAVAYAQATGKTKLLDVAEKHARHVNKVFFEGDPAYNDGKPVMQAPGHQEMEIGLIKLYNYTGNSLYLNMAKKFLEIRGRTFIPNGHHIDSPQYAQQHKPVSEQREAVGHAVRATYQYAAMAEVDSLFGADDYSKALNSIWHNIVDTKMHITGGLGAVPGIEGFGPSYVLPNKNAYLETCAAVGNVFFNMRMFLKYHDAKYVDVAEVALLNNCLSGVGLDGKSFFYPNPLEADDDHNPRSGWFGCACCPSNIARLIPQVPGYMYATDGNQLWFALYGSNQTKLALNGKDVSISQVSNYPYEGNITVKVDTASPVKFNMNLRIPIWVGKQFVPGELYHYAGDSSGWNLKVNGKTLRPKVKKGFVSLNRTWKAGDTVELQLDMPVRVNTCIEQVEANRDRICFTRGPLLFCAEGVDNDGLVQRFYVEPEKVLKGLIVKTINTGKLSGLPAITLPAVQNMSNSTKGKYFTKGNVNLIPYFAWSNRDRSSMITWFGTRASLTKPDPRFSGEMKFASVNASYTCQNDTVNAVRMRNTPKSSGDKSIRRWTSWPESGKSQWVEITLEQKSKILDIGVYWYNDNGGVQLPGKWHIEVPSGNGWKKLDIYNTDQYSCLADSYNTVHPANELNTDKIRIVMEPAHNQTCVGILSVNINLE